MGKKEFTDTIFDFIKGYISIPKHSELIPI